MKMTILKIALAILIFLTPLLVAAQCENAYEDAKENFDSGKPDLVEDILLATKCLEKLPKTRQLDALKLLILAFISLDNSLKSDQYMQKLLELEPEYRLLEDDPIEFKNLFYSYRSDPYLSLGLSVQNNVTFVRGISYFSVDKLSSTQVSYQSRLPVFSGFCISADAWLSKRWVLQSGLIAKSQTFEKVSTVLGFARTQSRESLIFIEIPANLRYEIFNYRRHKLIGFFGSSYVFTNSSQLVANRKDVTDPNRRILNSTSIDLLAKRRRHNVSIQLGLGLQFKAKRGFWAVNSGYQTYIFEHDIKSKKLSNTALVSEYFYVDDSFRLENLYFSVGYFYSFFKAKKISYD